MVGDVTDMQSRLRSMLPTGWFADDSPVLSQLLGSCGSAFAAFWTLLGVVSSQVRIATASGLSLDRIATDFFGKSLARFSDEQDLAFRLRVTNELLRTRGTRAALINALLQLTGRAPELFEPGRTTDTGGYTIGGLGYGAAGGWGNLSLPYQFFLTAYRPSGGGIAELAGYGSGGIPVYGNIALQAVGLSDSIITAAVVPLLPAASIAWMRIKNLPAA